MLDAAAVCDCLVRIMKTKIFAALIGIGTIVAITGCVSTVGGTHSPAVSFGQDSLSGTYERSIDQVYRASLQVIQNDGTLVTEYIPHDTTNNVRAFFGKVNDHNVWVRVEAVDPNHPLTEVTVQARSKWGSRDIDLVHELEKEIGMQLAR
jgi:hypothetical protein